MNIGIILTVLLVGALLTYFSGNKLASKLALLTSIAAFQNVFVVFMTLNLTEKPMANLWGLASGLQLIVRDFKHLAVVTEMNMRR